ncbi:glycosyltransferase [Nonlabens sp. SY33080]|uniref:glycosyltransferase n=1 Tax=Nonlabens sp. SY33080 TaxID=2719911 RepID=UPI001428953B|nr:glycosyltransferase [Nonlabens sp. SY33080]
MNIAIFSPSQNPYSETFIQAHKNHLHGKVFYYYGTGATIALEKVGRIYQPAGLKQQLLLKIKGKKQESPWEQLALHLKSNQIDSILIEYGTHAHHLLPLLNLIDIPVVVHFHGYDASMQSAIESSNQYKEVFLRANHVISVSQDMKEKLLSINCPEDKLVLNTYGPRDEFFKVEAQFSKKQLIAVGRFTDKKAPYYTILAFSKIAKQHPDAKLIMAGKGELLNTCKNLVQHLNLQQQVLFPGVIDASAFKNYLKESRAFVQHSITASSGDMEGTPLAVLESSAAGLPVISTTHAGIKDVVQHKISGLLCEEHDVTTMAAHMDTLLSHREQAIEMGKNAKNRIKDDFTLEKHITTLNNLLKSK